MKILLLSDIHLISTGAPEQQGQILQAFFTDIQNQLTRKIITIIFVSYLEI